MAQKKYAFPVLAEDHEDGGMHLRDFFASKVLTTVQTHPDCPLDEDETIRIARHCYSIADAMMIVRKEEQ